MPAGPVHLPIFLMLCFHLSGLRDSGLHVAGQLHWLHIAANGTLTWYGLHAKRGMDAITAHGILPNHLSVLVEHCWARYWKLDGATHSLCNAHLLRELLYVKELTATSGSRR